MVIPEEDAKEYWLDAIDILSDKLEQAINDDDLTFASIIEDEIVAGESIAEELDWK